MKLARKLGSTSQIFQVFIADTSSITGAGLTGLTNASGSLTAYYHRDTDTTATAISLVTMTVGTFTSSGFKEIDATNTPGWYQFCPPNAALASGAASCLFHLKGATNMAPLPIEVDLDAQVDVTSWNGTAVASPATAGIPDVNAKNINNVATTSVTTINANQGTTQPLNFTGTAGSALVKSDMVDIAGATVSASTAQLGVNLVNWNGTAATSTVPPDAIFIRSGTAQAGAASTITLDAGASATNNIYQNEIIFIRSGTGANQSNIIASYVGSTKVATVSNAWATAPDNTSVFTIMAPGPVIASVSGTVTANVTQWNGSAVAVPATAGIPDINVKNISNLIATGNAAFGPVWDVVRASHTTSGTFGGDTVTPPTNFSSLAIDGSGDVTFNNTTLATVTNLTNAPTSGDLTATMKASVTTAATAATPTAAAVTGNVGGNVTGSIGSLGATAKTDVSTAVLTTQMTESYAAKGTVPTLAQATFETRAILAEKAIASTTVTTKKIDGTTTAHTYTINSSTAPTSITTAS